MAGIQSQSTWKPRSSLSATEQGLAQWGPREAPEFYSSLPPAQGLKKEDSRLRAHGSQGRGRQEHTTSGRQLSENSAFLLQKPRTWRQGRTPDKA